jgi:ADP-ribosyl-[dinitrogen reductase] hydrolase
VTEVTHDHPEGIKGAEAVAVVIVLAKQGKTKEEIKEYVEDRYYRLDFTIDSIRENHMFDQTCQGTVPEDLECFFESDSFEDAIRNAISLGGDTDTLAAITGSVAEAYYGIPQEIITQAKTYLDAHLGQIVSMWEHAKDDR